MEATRKVRMGREAKRTNAVNQQYSRSVELLLISLRQTAPLTIHPTASYRQGIS